jgi:uracil-DNA glycosylase
MDVRISDSWKTELNDEFSKAYFERLTSFVKCEYNDHTIYPDRKHIFSAFDHCSFDEVKVVIIGQDPYHGVGQANGLCFSVVGGIRKPPSLVNIFKEIKEDMGTEIPESGNLERWADQGVLLLNATLTVRASTPGSHQDKGWETFTDAIIQKVSAQKEGVVFLLWGAYAQRKGAIINSEKHCVLQSPHPSPFAAYKGFFGNRHFSKTNEYLRTRGKSEIVW